MLATVTWRPDTTAEWRIHRETFNTKHPPLTYPVLAKHRSATPEAPVHRVKHRCLNAVPEKQTIEWTTYHPKQAYLLQYIHNYLVQGHKRNNEYIQMSAAAAEIIHQGIGVYTTHISNRPPAHDGPLQQRERVSTPTNQQPHATYPVRTNRTPAFLQAPQARWASQRQPAGQLENYDQAEKAHYRSTT